MGVTKQRRKFDADFKRNAVLLSLQPDKTPTQVAADLNLGINVLSRWRREYLKDSNNAFPGNGKLKLEDEELRRLRKENTDLKMERDILKKALGYFSSPRT
jgi:transposase